MQFQFHNQFHNLRGGRSRRSVDGVTDEGIIWKQALMESFNRPRRCQILRGNAGGTRREIYVSKETDLLPELSLFDSIYSIYHHWTAAILLITIQ